MTRYFYLILLLFMTANVMSTTDKISVFVSILPQKYFVERVGGQHVHIEVMVGPGHSPATYEPTPQQMLSLAQADVYFSIGVPFEKAWLDKIQSNYRALMVIPCCTQFASLYDHHHHTHGEHYDPHIWGDPNKVIKLVQLIEEHLMHLDSQYADTYQTLASDFINDLKQLDEYIVNKTKHLKNRILIVSHPAWSYFAARYKFKQISIERQGKEIQAGQIVALIKRINNNGIKTIFMQPQFNHRAVEVIKRETGVEVVEIDPLAPNYIENMRQVTDKISQGLSQ